MSGRKLLDPTMYKHLRNLTLQARIKCLIEHFHRHSIAVSLNSTQGNTGCLQMNGAVSKVNKKFISHLTRAKHTPSAAATVQVSHALPAVRSLVLAARLRGQFPR